MPRGGTENILLAKHYGQQDKIWELAQREKETDGLASSICISSPDKTYGACKLPGETARCAREGRKHAPYNNGKNNARGTAATRHAKLLACKWIAGKAPGGARHLRSSACVHLVYCLKREYIRLTVAADVFHERLTL